MKLLIAATAALLVTTQAQAHITKGTWLGQTPDGKACEMVVGEQYFENDLRHPLAERIPVTINATKFLVGHPAVIDAATSTASFNHDLFQGVSPIGTPRGANAVVIEMRHEAKEGPENYTFITHDYASDARSSLVCKGLTLQP